MAHVELELIDLASYRTLSEISLIRAIDTAQDVLELRMPNVPVYVERAVDRLGVIVEDADRAILEDLERKSVGIRQATSLDMCGLRRRVREAIESYAGAMLEFLDEASTEQSEQIFAALQPIADARPRGSRLGGLFLDGDDVEAAGLEAEGCVEQVADATMLHARAS